MAKIADLVVSLELQSASFKKGMDDMRGEVSKTRESVEKARGTLELLGDSLGVRLPRELHTVLANMQTLNTFLKTAFTGAAIFAGFNVLKEQVIPAIKEATTFLGGMDEALKSIEEDATKASAALLFKMNLAPTLAELQNLNTRIAEATKLRDELQKATGQPLNYGGTLGPLRFAADTAALHELNKQLAVDEKERIGLLERIKTLNDDAAKNAQDAAKKAADAANQHASALAKVRDELQSIAGLKPDDPFIVASEKYRAAIDKIRADLAQFPELQTTGVQRIGGLAIGAFNDFLKDIKGIGDAVDAEISKILGKSLNIQSVPTLPAKTAPTLSAGGQLLQIINEQLKAISQQDQFNRSVDDLILRLGTATDGAKVFFRQYADYAKDTAQVVHDAFARVFGALEDQLTNLIANFKFDIASLAQTIRESIARALVQRFILGPIASLLGGKRDGSSAKNALFVEVVNGGLGAPGPQPVPGTPGTPTDIVGKIQGEMGKIFSSIGQFFAKIGSALVSAFKAIGSAIGSLFGGGFADGGDLTPGKFYLVGERGPELFAPGRSFGAVIPNHFIGGNQRTQNVTINQYLTPIKSDPFGYSESQLTNATLIGLARAGGRA